jgi:hypothetical protein
LLGDDDENRHNDNNADEDQNLHEKPSVEVVDRRAVKEIGLLVLRARSSVGSWMPGSRCADLSVLAQLWLYSRVGRSSTSPMT